jgi:hypothetical protein
MCDRDKDPLDLSLFRRALGDAGMWALVPILLLLGGGFLLFTSIFADEFMNRWDLYLGGLRGRLGTGVRSAHGGSWVHRRAGADSGRRLRRLVWEQFRDGGSISAVTYVGGGYDGSYWVGHVHNYDERAATVTCQLEALGPEGDVIGIVEVTATNVRPNGGQFVEGEIDVPPSLEQPFRRNASRRVGTSVAHARHSSAEAASPSRTAWASGSASCLTAASRCLVSALEGWRTLGNDEQR